MFFLRWITGHPILSLLVLTLVYAVINWSNLHEWSGNKDAATTDQVATTEHAATQQHAATTQTVVETHAKAGAPDVHAAASIDTDGIDTDGIDTDGIDTDSIDTENTTERKGLFGRWFGGDEKATENTETDSAVTDVAGKAADLVSGTAAKTTAAVAAGTAATIAAAKAVVPGNTATHTASTNTDAKAEVATQGQAANSENQSKDKEGLFGHLLGGKKQTADTTSNAVTDVVGTAGNAVTDTVGKAGNVVTGTAAKATAVVAAGTAATVAAAKAVVPGNTEVDVQANDEKKSLFGFFKKDEDSASVEPATNSDAAVSASANMPNSADKADMPQTEATPENQKSLFGFFNNNGDKSTANSGQTQVAAAAPSSSVQDPKPSLQSARQAFWNRDFAGSAAIYENLVASDPQNPDLLGEYGNMLVQAGKVPAALDLYEKATGLLIDQKRFKEVHPLVGFIGNFDPQRANKIVEHLRNH
jgi:hypothetical protein